MFGVCFRWVFLLGNTALSDYMKFEESQSIFQSSDSSIVSVSPRESETEVKGVFVVVFVVVVRRRFTEGPWL